MTSAQGRRRRLLDPGGGEAIDPLLMAAPIEPRLGFEDFYREQRDRVGRALAVTFNTAVRVTDTNVVVSMRQRLDLIGADDPLPEVTVLVGTLQ